MQQPTSNDWFQDTLARIILSGRYDLRAIAQRIVDALQLERCRPAADRLAQEVSNNFATPPTILQLRTFLIERGWRNSKFLRKTGVSTKQASQISGSLFQKDTFHAASPRLAQAEIPKLSTPEALATWLDLEPSKLEWLTQQLKFVKAGNADPRYEHYAVKQNQKVRILEVPYPRLMIIQRKILHGILDNILPHAAAHGFCKQRSIQSYVTPHVGQQLLWRTDFANFFPSINIARVRGFLRTVGYPPTVAMALANLLTTRLTKYHLHKLLKGKSPEMLQQFENLFSASHLPQGAPSSPAIANLICFRLDSRLTGLAKKYDATYTRYADDLAFSGNTRFKRNFADFRTTALAIILDEGFQIRERKTVVMSASRQQKLTGVIVNERPNIPRKQFKQLHAILHNCLMYGPASQNHESHPDFRNHLRGRITWVRTLNPHKADKLQQLFDQIIWTEDES